MKKWITTEIFIEKAKVKHGDNLDYSKAVYMSNKDKVFLRCKKHNLEFSQEPRNVYIQSGCILCHGENIRQANKSSQEAFIKLAKDIHGESYDYSKVNYINNNTGVDIYCIKCEKYFNQLPRSHICGRYSGCPNHSGGSISRIEVRWLDSLGVAKEYRQKTILVSTKKFKVDAYNPITNTIYEFYGDFWHGHPDYFDQNEINPISKKSFGVLYKDTLERHNYYISNNFNVISIWEHEFK